MFKFHVDSSGIAPWAQRVDAAARKAASMAGGSAVKAMRAEASRRIRERKALKVAAVNNALVMFYPEGPKDRLLWKVRASGAAMPVIAFGSPSQGRRGVNVTINKGPRTLIPHAFIATMKSGHRGVFVRYGQKSIAPIMSGYRGHKRYAGQKRQPIRELYTTTIANAFTDAAPAAADRGAQVFVQTFARLMATR